MAVQRGKAVIDRDYTISRIDPRIYGGFIEHMGRCVYGGIYDPKHAEADASGFRQDVLAMVQELQVPMIRYPGGNFVSGFRWEDSVGPKAERPVRMDAAWKSIEPNEVGLNEFHGWADRAGSEVMMAVNLGTRGVEAAAQLLEYCNVKGGTAFSELRKKHGRTEPYDYKVWCLGNEMDGPWQICNKSAEEYGVLARETAKVMKRIDPSIELVACGSSSMNLPTFPQWDATVMELIYEQADYLSVHLYIDNKEDDLDNYLLKGIQMDRYIESITATCDYVKAKKRSSKVMNLSFDEWNVVPGNWKKNDVEPWTFAPALCEGNYSMADAVVFGNMIISLLKHSDRVKIACLAQLVNVFGPVMTSSDGTAWKQSVYYPYLHASLFGRGIAMNVQAEVPAVTTQHFTDAPMLDSVAVMDEQTGDLTIFAVNRSSSDALELSLELRGFGGEYTLCERLVMKHEDGGAYNSSTDQTRVVPEQLETVAVNHSFCTVELEPMSWNVLRFRA
ncbi:arabinosylfuranosidase ArfA [Paenibacillus cremeus]|uniref:non-reducing end alpha-L-arabinofuranosidase n=1 Tax=Paenibacillus cremeus TaxID=2163881 RepID=A0A559K9M3_9BACL|nr:alpha-N-arabinofuranosidase [Paenibacillus cremeus]TVY08837.1 alpha-N-arabinofuranosidase [Paenibacillus cremeus]